MPERDPFPTDFRLNIFSDPMTLQNAVAQVPVDRLRFQIPTVMDEVRELDPTLGVAPWAARVPRVLMN